MPAPRKYSDELRERAVRMVNETLKDNPGLAHKRACHQVGEQLGIPGATLRNWFRNAAPTQLLGRGVAAGGPGRPGRWSWNGRTVSCDGRTRS